MHITILCMMCVCVDSKSCALHSSKRTRQQQFSSESQSLRRKRSVAIEKRPPDPICESVWLRRKVEPVKCCGNFRSTAHDHATSQKHIPQSESNLFLPQKRCHSGRFSQPEYPTAPSKDIRKPSSAKLLRSMLLQVMS